MKRIIFSLVMTGLISLVITPALSAISFADRARQTVATKLEQAQKTLTSINENVSSFGSCVLKGNCSSDRQKSLSTTLKASVAALGAIIVALLAAAVIAGKKDTKSQVDQDGIKAQVPQQPISMKSLTPEQKKGQFLYALLNHDVNLAEELIVFQNVNPNMTFENLGNLNAISIAARENDAAMVQLLLSAGAKPMISSAIGEISPAIRDTLNKPRGSFEERKSELLREHEQQMRRINQ